MFDRSACAEAHVAADARADLAALTALPTAFVSTVDRLSRPA